MRTMPQLYNVAVLRGVDERRSKIFAPECPRDLGCFGGYQKFSANKLSFDIDVPAKAAPGWFTRTLIIPGWKAFVDERESLFLRPI